jgi:UDP-N-acetylglucosamine 2-epimerase (non-hydrolysing)
MPEEINRLVTDAITDVFFTTSETANANLRRAGVGDERIHFVGNTMIDTLLANVERLRKPDFWERLALADGEYFVLTLHRPNNVDSREPLLELLARIGACARGLAVVFPAHPRTVRVLGNTADIPSGIALVDPQPYLEFIYLVQRARAVITDSGGITEETTVLGVPCLTLRDTTERPETVTQGTNVLIGHDPTALGLALDRLFAGDWQRGSVPEKWDGRSGERIVAHLERMLPFGAV